MTDIPEIPFGAIENGRVFLQRLADHYDFTCEAGPLASCIEYHEAVRCFEFIAQWIFEFSVALPHLSSPCAVEVRPSSLVNAASILASDAPHIVVQKLDAAYSQIVTKPVDVAAVRRQAFEEGFENGVEQSLNALDAYDDITRNEAEQGIRKLKPDYRALSAEPAQGEQWQPTHRHVKRGTEYQLIGTGKMQAENWATYSDENGYENADMQEVAIYRGDDSKLWVRPIAEFNDGRFVDLPAAPTPEAR